MADENDWPTVALALLLACPEIQDRQSLLGPPLAYRSGCEQICWYDLGGC
jgi:hypothetical protein